MIAKCTVVACPACAGRVKLPTLELQTRDVRKTTMAEYLRRESLGMFLHWAASAPMRKGRAIWSDHHYRDALLVSQAAVAPGAR